MACAPPRSLAALTICGTYATTRTLLHSVNAVSVMSAIVIPRTHHPGATLFRVVCRIDELAPAWPGAAHLDHHRLPHLDEMSDVGGLGVETSRGQRLQRRFIELFAIARVPS